MAKKAYLGGKIRRLRRERAMTQVDMAGALGISPSYLNLIEHNQRPLTLSLLFKIGKVFEVNLEMFSEDADSRLVSDFTEMFGDPIFRGADIAPGEVIELVAAAPVLAQEIISLYGAFRAAREDVRGLSERLSDEQFLSTSTHELRTFLTSIRSFSEILRDHGDLGRRQRDDFLARLVEEIEKLGTTIDEMLEFAAAAGPDAGSAGAPAEEVRDLLQARGNYFPELEEVAETLRDALELDGHRREEILAGELARRHGVGVRIVPVEAAETDQEAVEANQNSLLMSEVLSRGARAFRLAREIVMRERQPAVEDALADERLTSPDSKSLARRALSGYLAAAMLMPYERFLSAATATRYDIELLARRFETSLEQVCHRLTTLRRPGAAGLPLHFLRVDLAGNVSKQFSISGLHVPRYGGLCPRWNVHAAFLSPYRFNARIERLPDGATYLNVARAVRRSASRAGDPDGWYALGIGCEVAHARSMVYSDGIDLGPPLKTVPVGVTCRLCERHDCAERVTPAVFRAASA